MAVKSLVLATLFLAGLVARGAEARIAAIIYGTVPCTARPNQATVLLEISGNDDDPTAGNIINTRTNNEGQFMVVLNVTSSEMMDSLMGGSRVAVACNASLPAIGTLEEPVVPHGARILGATAADNVRREILDQSPSLLPGVAQGVDFLFNNATMEVLRELADILPSGVSYGGGTLDAYVAFGVGPFSYSPNN